MGLDIYAGTLTRYYSHNWKTVTQQWAEANGYAFRKFTPEGEQAGEDTLDPDQVRPYMEGWRDHILSALAQPDRPPYTPWPEDGEKPYYTDKPDWDALGALMVVIACQVYGEPVPPTVQKGWDYTTHPAVARLAEDPERVWSLLRGATWWLPLSEPFLFRGPLPNENTAVLGTTAGLRIELEWLNRSLWQAGEETILAWADTEGYPTDAVYGPDGKLDPQGIREHTEYDTLSLAKFAFSLFWRALNFAEEQKVPILLDY